MPAFGAAFARADASAAAWAGVMPGRRRAMALNIEMRPLCDVGSISEGTSIGNHARVSRSGNAKSGPITPTIVRGESPNDQRAPDDVGPAAETLLPQSVREEDDWR